jgi:hypothetical protein
MTTSLYFSVYMLSASEILQHVLSLTQVNKILQRYTPCQEEHRRRLYKKIEKQDLKREGNMYIYDEKD